jgi:hypothetical protein
MSENHLYICGNRGLLIIGFIKKIADFIPNEANMGDYNLYTDFTIQLNIPKLDLLYIYKKNDQCELPLLGLSAREIQYLYAEDL